MRRRAKVAAFRPITCEQNVAFRPIACEQDVNEIRQLITTGTEVVTPAPQNGAAESLSTSVPLPVFGSISTNSPLSVKPKTLSFQNPMPQTCLNPMGPM